MFDLWLDFCEELARPLHDVECRWQRIFECALSTAIVSDFRVNSLFAILLIVLGVSVFADFVCLKLRKSSRRTPSR